MEFGSDFHYCAYPKGGSLLELLGDVNLYISGRQALIDLIKINNWERILLPSYYCFDFVKSILPYTSVKFYDCIPSSNIEDYFTGLNYSSNEAIIITNYYGMTSRPKLPKNISIIEDHSHDLMSDWAINSNADWCFASLRKTLPIADGGILWSPKGQKLPLKPIHTIEGENFAADRYKAMALKAQYIKGDDIDKDLFRAIYIKTENEFDTLPISSISEHSLNIISQLDIKEWYNRKKRNWNLAIANIKINDNIKVLAPEPSRHNAFPFSIILKFSSHAIRDRFRTLLIQNRIYPAILWSIPSDKHSISQDFSNTMLSIHCDARYNSEEMMIMINRINNIIKCL